MIGFWINFILLSYVFLLAAQIALIVNFLLKNIPLPAWLTRIHVAGSALLLIVFLIFLVLFTTDQFQYFQVWSHSSKTLPLYFKIASTWEGQEGSFLLWALFQSLVGTWLISRKNRLANYSVAIVLLVQLFLVLPLVHFNFSQNNFFLFSNTADVLNINQDTLASRWFLEKGKGMNPLLRNFWMTVHPPVMFLAFALASIPFALTLIGVSRKDLSWLTITQRCLKISLATLTLGILMGTYWAYETLNFGGYWSWDPVENAIFLPWLVGLAALHLNWVAVNSHKHLGFAAVLNCLYFVLIVYSTFLTRSGLLQNTSVHAFVDNGYQSLLTFFLISIVALPLSLFLIKQKKLFAANESIHFNKKQDWLFITGLVFLLAALHVFINTSIPVFNYVLNNVGIKANFAPPANTISYSFAQGIFALILLILLLIIELSMQNVKILRIILAVVITWSVSIKLQQLVTLHYVLALTLVILSGLLFFVLIKKIVAAFRTSSLSGSLLSHVGFTFLLIGIIFSHNLLDPNNKIKQHTLLSTSQSKIINGAPYRFEGRFVKDANGDLIDARLLRNSLRPGRFIAKDTIQTKNEIYFPGRIVSSNINDLYFHVTNGTREESFFSHVYFENENSYFVTPSISHDFLSDTYLNISNFQDSRKITWKDSVSFNFKNLNTASENPHIRKADLFPLPILPGVYLNENKKAYTLALQWGDGSSVCLLNPIVIAETGNHFTALIDFSAKDGIAAYITDWRNENDFNVKILLTEKDWVTIQVEEKPLINFFWLGGILMAGGIFLSLKDKKAWKKEEVSYDKNFKGTVMLFADQDSIIENEKVC